MNFVWCLKFDELHECELNLGFGTFKVRFQFRFQFRFRSRFRFRFRFRFRLRSRFSFRFSFGFSFGIQVRVHIQVWVKIQIQLLDQVWIQVLLGGVTTLGLNKKCLGVWVPTLKQQLRGSLNLSNYDSRHAIRISICGRSLVSKSRSSVFQNL